MFLYLLAGRCCATRIWRREHSSINLCRCLLSFNRKEKMIKQVRYIPVPDHPNIEYWEIDEIGNLWVVSKSSGREISRLTVADIQGMIEDNLAKEVTYE